MRIKHRGQVRPRKRLVLGAPVWIAGAAVVLLLLAGALALSMGNAEPVGGKLAAERTTLDFGRVSMAGGLLKTKFALSVQGSPVVTKLLTN